MKSPLVALSIALFGALLGSACFGRAVPATGGVDGGAGSTTLDDDVRACEDDTDCGERSLCRGGLCVDVGAGCTRKSECGPELVCVDGSCAPAPASCNSSEECLGALLCDGFSHTCFDPSAVGCRTDGECALEPGCAGGCTCLANGTCASTGSPTEPGPGEPPLPTPDPEPPTPSTGTPIELGGFVLENREHDPATQVGRIPDGTRLVPGQHLVIAREAEREEFEAFWEISLGDDVVFLNAQAGTSGIPIVNGGERWALLSPLGSVVDGVTIAGRQGTAYRRVSVGNADSAAAWENADANLAVPGSTLLPSVGVGLVVAQWSDAPGSGTFAYEFVELYYAP